MQISARTRKILFWCALALSILWLLFIFSNSLETGVESDQKSSSVTQFINNVLHAIGFKGEIPHSTVRKLAHFGEFAILAIFVCVTLYCAPKKLSVLFSPAICFVCASIDETIQIFTDGRGAQISDVAIDTFGAICGTAGIMFLYFIIIKITEKTKKHL